METKHIAIIVLIAAVAIFLYTQDDNFPSLFKTNQNNQSGGSSQGANTQDSNTTTTNTQEQDSQTQEGQQTTTNQCGNYNYGFPDYEGTQNEGKNCADFPSYQMDNECLANPPPNYDGLIDLSDGTSNPEITCCEQDGTCQW